MTPAQKTILAHEVADPEAWEKHARVYAVKAWNQDVAQLSKARDELTAVDQGDSMAKKLDGILARQKALTDAGPEPYFERFLSEKVARIKPLYEAASAQPGYKNRAERDAEAEAKRQEELAKAAARKAEAEAQKKEEFAAAVRAEALRLKAHGAL